MKNPPNVPSSVRELAGVLSQPKPMRRGSVSERTMKCGKAGCPCQEDPKARGPCLGVTAGGPGVGRGTQNSEAVQASRNLIAVAAFLSFPTFNHLPRSLLPFKFGIPNAHV